MEIMEKVNKTVYTKYNKIKKKTTNNKNNNNKHNLLILDFLRKLMLLFSFEVILFQLK